MIYYLIFIVCLSSQSCVIEDDHGASGTYQSLRACEQQVEFVRAVSTAQHQRTPVMWCAIKH